MLYVDPALFGAPNGMPCVIELFGRDRVLFGTDAPLDTQGGSRFIPTTISDVERSVPEQSAPCWFGTGQ
jgi:predicted TIM-barrel fold metal-dependent hydrolase